MEYPEIPGLTGYGASAEGDVLNLRTGRPVAQRRARNGALQVNIGKSTRMVHDLVARAHYGHPLCPGYRVKHRNGDFSDNQVENLVWGGRPRSLPGQSATLGRGVESEYLRIRQERLDLTELMQS